MIEKAKKYKRVIIFGYDELGVEIYAFLYPHLSEDSQIAFCDNSIDKQDNKKVFSVQTAISKFSEALFVIASKSHATEMREQLIKYGIEKKDILEFLHNHSMDVKFQPSSSVRTVNVPVLYGELLKGKVALITGANRGIGFYMAKAFLANGADVIITGRNIDNVEESCAKLSKCFGNARVKGANLDVTDFDFLKTRILEIIEDEKIDILVNNAGISKGAIFGKTKQLDWDDTIGTNLKSLYFVSQIVARYMKEKGIQGNILNILSSSSFRPALNPYTVSKWGGRGLTLGMAKQLIKYGIVVNGLAPGPTATDLLVGDNCEDIKLVRNPSGRFARPEEIANMAVVLTSELGRLIVGDVLCMTGGAGVITYDDIDYPF